MGYKKLYFLLAQVGVALVCVAANDLRQGYKRTVLHGIENCCLINRDRSTAT
ncbi:MAG: hypothetical protein V7L14_11740 [Nostoc sp.]|uniref:hypothetical protein n=1 Tax=Nostoc sp. TaxID=1180 RepID=UPI002FF9E6F6